MSGNSRARTVIQLLAAVLVTMAVSQPAGHAQARVTGTAEARSTVTEARNQDFDDGWRFALVNPAGITDPTGAYAHAADPGYDDSRWRQVDLPHDWSIEQDPTQADGTDSGTGYLPGGLGWYRKTFTLPHRLAGRRIGVEFDGVYMDSVVYFNGKQVAAHPYGYTGFQVDLTEEAHTDGTPNVLAVKVQNQLPSSRWYSGSGIYRDVHLIVTTRSTYGATASSSPPPTWPGPSRRATRTSTCAPTSPAGPRSSPRSRTRAAVR
jgi:beta-galactosidase